MVKNILAFLCVLCLTAFIAPTYMLNNVTVCVNGKSSGDFITEDITFYNLFKRDGVSASLTNDYNYQIIVKKLDAKIVHRFNDGSVNNLYYYTEKLPKKEIINGKAVNLHFAITENNIVVGTPIIYGGY